MIDVRHLIFSILVLCANTSAGVTANDYQIEVSKSSRELRVLESNQVIRTFNIALGKNGNGTKRRLGDNLTPAGTYKVIEFKTDSKFHFFMQLNYPNTIDAWHGYRDQIIDSMEFSQIVNAIKNNKLPPQHTALGGYIGIHGIGEITGEKLEIHEAFNWTEGCVALKNEDINELRKYVSLGTMVVIRE
jgi:murein L,D-transpeptidase YafK